jgi:hypothetical protein
LVLTVRITYYNRYGKHNDQRNSATGTEQLDQMLKDSYVPLVLNIFVDIMVAPNPSQVRNEFNLEEFRKGKLLDKGYY